MIRLRFASAAAVLLTASAAAAHAQMPRDNDAWKSRCAVLASQTADLNHLSPAVAELTRGVPGSKFQTFGFDRQAAGEHNVACTLFYLAAIANQASKDASAAKDAQLLANLEVKAMKGQQPSFTENLSRTKIKAYEITRPALTLTDEEKVLLAATTIPYTGGSSSVKPLTMTASNKATLKR